MNRNVVLKLAEAIKQNKAVVHLTIVDQQGSSPRHNAEMLIDESGTILAGTIGGGAVEQKAIEDGIKALKKGDSNVVHYKLKMDKNDKEALQMACGGDVSVLIRPYLRTRRIVTVGAGHISLALSKMAELLGYQYVVVDDRPEFASAARFPNATIVVGDVKVALDQLETYQSDAFVIVSHDHVHDIDALIALKDKPHFYLGMIGSKKKVLYSYEQIKKQGLSLDPAQVHAPIGIDIGGEAPAEIALAIMAEIQAVWHGKKVKNLKVESGKCKAES
ncbi:MAG: hypothetical protein CSA13_02330 [Clostridiales bacterium]|nr:MAG: hypothetical protein CSA13_02330 [Clostridiales bacterium]